MENLIPEKEARELLLKYEGFNNQILDWKLKMVTNVKYNLTRTQSEYASCSTEGPAFCSRGYS